MLGWSVHKLAAEASLTKNTVIAFENDRPVSPATVAAIEEALTRHGFGFAKTARRTTIHRDH